jgi:CRP-like cAMP-binding protein
MVFAAQVAYHRFHKCLSKDSFVINVGNQLLAQLEASEHHAVMAQCQLVELQAGQLLSDPQRPLPWVYFPDGATLASLLPVRASAVLAVGLTGREGAAGLSYALGMGPGPFRLQSLTPGRCWRMPAHALAALMDQSSPLVLLLMRQLWRFNAEMAELLGSQPMLDIPTRLAVWLNLIAVRANSQVLALTQLQLAQLLGVRRVSITLATQTLRNEGLIDCRRALIRVLDGPGLLLRGQAR